MSIITRTSYFKEKEIIMLAIDLRNILSSHTILWSYFDTDYLLHIHNLDSTYSISSTHVIRRVTYADDIHSALDQVLVTDVRLWMVKRHPELDVEVPISLTVSIEGSSISVNSYVDTKDKSLRRAIEQELEEADYQYYPLYEQVNRLSFLKLMNFDLYTKEFMQLNDIIDRSKFRNHLMVDYSLNEIIMDFLNSFRFKIKVKTVSSDIRYELSMEILHKRYALNEYEIAESLNTAIEKVSFAGIDRYYLSREFYSLDDAIMNGIALARHVSFKHESNASIKVKILSR